MALRIDLSGRNVLITGVTDGIGAGIARVCAEAGCNVAGCGRRGIAETGTRAFIESVESQGRKAFYMPCDVSTPQGPKALVTKVAEAMGGIDWVVSNAGRNVFEGVNDCSDEQWQMCMDLDLASHWRLAKAAHPYLAAGRSPVFITIGSNHAYSTLPGCFPYNVAKAGLLALSQSLALEWGPTIRAVGVIPGFIDPPGNDVWFNSFDDPHAKRSVVEDEHPVGRIGTPEELGGLCVFLASQYARFISGTNLLIDGGHSAKMGW